MGRYIIWTDDLDMDIYESFIKEEYPEADEDEIYRIALSNIAMDFDCTKIELSLPLGKDIIAIADLGLWNGRKTAYKIIGSNLSDVFSVGEDINTWYVDEDGDLRLDAVHHDGINHILFRLIKDSADVFDDGVTNELIEEHTMPLRRFVEGAYGYTLTFE